MRFLSRSLLKSLLSCRARGVSSPGGSQSWRLGGGWADAPPQPLSILSIVPALEWSAAGTWLDPLADERPLETVDRWPFLGTSKERGRRTVSARFLARIRRSQSAWAALYSAFSLSTTLRLVPQSRAYSRVGRTLPVWWSKSSSNRFRMRSGFRRYLKNSF